MTSGLLESVLKTIHIDLEFSSQGDCSDSTRVAVMLLLNSIIRNGYPAPTDGARGLYASYFEDCNTDYTDAQEAVDNFFYATYGIYFSDHELLDFLGNVLIFSEQQELITQYLKDMGPFFNSEDKFVASPIPAPGESAAFH